MSRTRIPAVFMRGGTCKGVFFHARDLPTGRAEQEAIFLEMIGSPDPYNRQLDGMGGGISSVSKAVIIEKSKRPDADIDYTFAQLGVDNAIVEWGSTCGNLSTCVGPFALEEGLIEATDGEATVRVFITNTGKTYESRFPVKDGIALERGDFIIPGVPGGGAKVSLCFNFPGGGVTGNLLPTGHECDNVLVDGLGNIATSMVDATNAVSFIAAKDLGLDGTESPDELEADKDLMARVDAIRRATGVKIGLANRPEDVTVGNPKIAIVGRPKNFTAIDGTRYTAEDQDISIRIVNLGRINRAVTLTGAMCLGVATLIDGSIPNQLVRGGATIRIANPSGVLPVEAAVKRNDAGVWEADMAGVFSTQRRLMEGHILVTEASKASS
jgi:2-methylaconitate cis-trans-isomerase PrpF